MHTRLLSSMTAALLILGAGSMADAQQTGSIFGGNTETSFVWGLDLRTDSVQGETGTMFAFSAGALLNRSLLIAFTGGLNLSHEVVNFGYLGLLTQYTFNPDRVFHPSVQLILGSGSAKDYEQEKTSLLDNYGNISGPGFFLLEPGANGELNLTDKTRLVFGISYRLVSGMDEDDTLIASSGATNGDLSGLCFNFGFKFGVY